MIPLIFHGNKSQLYSVEKKSETNRFKSNKAFHFTVLRRAKNQSLTTGSGNMYNV